MSVMASEQKRICLWTVPRSLSSAFFRAMNNASGTKGVFEPFCQAYYFGTEQVSSRYSKDPPMEGATYTDIKTQLEEPYAGQKVVFVKDLAFALLASPQSHLDILPAGYQHTFLIRDPRKSVPSLYKISNSKDEIGWDYYDSLEVGFKDLYHLFTTVTETLGQEAIILDADDILSHPEEMIHQYCERTGMDFQRVMLHWDEAPPEKMEAFKDWPMGWFRTMLSSSTFNKPSESSKSIDISKQPLVVQQSIQDSQPYYDKLYKLRMLPRKDC